ncbi:MAG: sensor histidine kinase [Treponema sp.]|jgi:hypothetical protein|nr:sensor histidine kinase [Treponema sp.]
MHFTLADLVTDITQNACESGAALVELEVKENDKEFRFLVKDNGKGMTKEELGRALDPFVTDGVKHPRRKVGLGLPFLVQTAEQSGGGWDIQSEKGEGTTASAWFDTGNVDTPPVGDLPGMFRTVLMFEGRQEMVIRRSREGAALLEYELRKSELADAIGGFEDAGALALLGEYLRSQEQNEGNGD